jgi:rRNA maturation endonuclease Nob1
MPLIIACHGCGKILYEGWDMVSHYEIRIKNDGRCPACGKKLSITPLSLKLEPIKE